MENFLKIASAVVCLALAVWIGLDPIKSQPTWHSYLVSIALTANALLITRRTP